eukprot:69251-Pleurochrysis_carterae.AAC.1
MDHTQLAASVRRTSIRLHALPSSQVRTLLRARFARDWQKCLHWPMVRSRNRKRRFRWVEKACWRERRVRFAESSSEEDELLEQTAMEGTDEH